MTEEEFFEFLSAPDAMRGGDQRRCVYCDSLICDGCPICCDKHPQHKGDR